MRVCTRVFVALICTIIPPPSGKRTTSESQKLVDALKRRSPVPKTPHAAAIHMKVPRTSSLRDASAMPPMTAPTPVAPMRRPRVRASPWYTRDAKMGMSVV